MQNHFQTLERFQCQQDFTLRYGGGSIKGETSQQGMQ